MVYDNVLHELRGAGGLGGLRPHLQKLGANFENSPQSFCVPKIFCRALFEAVTITLAQSAHRSLELVKVAD